MICLQRKKFLSIGEMSKMSGVHIKSLRYYDRIGVLKPAYIDPDTNYRYYTYPQLGVVDAIQTCVELDIPLKQFAGFIEDEGQEIHYARLLEQGKEMAEKKIRDIREGLKQIELFLQEIKRSEVLMSQDQPVFRDVRKKRYFTIPLEKSISSDEYDKVWKNLYDEAISGGCSVGYETGLLYIYQKEEVRRYVFLEIISGGAKSQRILTLPAGRYISKCVEQTKIETAPEEFPELFANDNEKIVVGSVLYTGDFNVSKPVYELRCSVLQPKA